MKRIIPLIVLCLILLVGIVTADDAYTAFANYGDANKSYNNTYTVLKWNLTGNLTPFNPSGNFSSTTTVNYVVVGGGGGGGYRTGGGGGGAGGYWEGTLTGIATQQIVTVGAGGAASGSAGVSGTSGSNSIFASITANGGSGGGTMGTGVVSLVLQGGSSGGGGSNWSSGGGGIGLSNTSNQSGHGFYGGTGYNNSATNYQGGGGGSYLNQGVNGTSNKGGNGGNATSTNITGTLLTLAGGGGGGVYSNTITNRGLGGLNGTTGVRVGGSGAYRTTAATAAVANTGSGGGGGGSTGAPTAGTGGVIIISWKTIPNSTFTANSTGGSSISTIPVLFTDTSLNGIATTWGWNFTNVTGNNTPVTFSTSQNPVLSFGIGNYSIKLNGTSDGGSNISAQTTWINVSTIPISSFTTNVTSGNKPLPVSFTDTSINTPTAWNWSFNSSNLLTLNQATGTDAINDTTGFSKNQGTETILSCTTYYNEESRSLKVTFANITTNEGAVIYPSAIVNSPSKPYIASVYLRGDIGGEKVKIVINEKDSGDNWVDETSSPEITLTTTWTQYNISKVFGATGYRSQILVLSTIKESGTFYADSFQLEQGTQITQWQLPVNPTYFSSLQNPTYTFTNSGNYTVYLNSSNSNGYNVSNQNTFINVSTGGGILPPVASFTINKNLLRIPNTITVTDTSTNIPTSWDWQWGDGTANSTTQNPTHTYTTRGKFNIYLTATNAGGSGSTATATSVRVVGYENYY